MIVFTPKVMLPPLMMTQGRVQNGTRNSGANNARNREYPEGPEGNIQTRKNKSAKNDEQAQLSMVNARMDQVAEDQAKKKPSRDDWAKGSVRPEETTVTEKSGYEKVPRQIQINVFWRWLWWF
jgi:hypothetical protein